MKHLSYFLLGAAGLLLASCTNDDLQSPDSNSDGYSTLVLDVEIPSLQTRAFGDGTTATYLQYGIYEVNNDVLNLIGEPVEVELEGKQKKIELQLLNQKNYKIVFWAGADKRGFSGSSKLSPYQVSFDTNGVIMTCDQSTSYPNTKYWKINNDNLDAFFTTKDIYLNGNLTDNVELKRATAQINIGTNDYDKAKELGLFEKIEDLNVEVRVENVYSKLNLVTGEVSDPINKKFYFGDIDQNFIQQTFPVEGEYQYLGLVYAIVSPEQELVSLSYGYDTKSSTLNADDHKITNVPVQRNHRTNIYGSLFTDVMTINVSIDESFDDPEYNQNLDNMISEGVFYDEKTKTYTITTASGLAWIRDHNNNLSNSESGMNGYIVELGADIDLNNDLWEPMNNCEGIFDGKNFTISNFSVDQTQNKDASAGFFSTGRGTIKNLTIENADVKGNYKAGAVAGDGMCATFENVHVKNSTILSLPWKKDGINYDDGNNSGGIVGYLSCEPNGGITNCSVENSTVKGFRKVGGLTGYATAYDKDPKTIEGNTVKNVKVIVDKITNSYNKEEELGGELVGGIGKNITLSNNNIENVTVGVIKTNESGQFLVNKIGDLEILAIMGASYYAGKTILLENDMDLEGKDFNTVAFWSSNRATFDGQDHTISNIKLKEGRKGLFGATQANIKNLKVKGLKGDVGYDDAFVGLISNLYGDIENVHVEDVDINPSFENNPTLSYQVGGIVGIFNSGNMKNCSVKNAKLSGGSEVGGLTGDINETPNRTIEDCYVENITIYTKAAFFGLLTGNLHASGIKFKNCKYSGTNKYTFGTSQVDQDLNMGIRYPQAAFTWNETNVTKGIKSFDDWAKLWQPSNN